MREHEFRRHSTSRSLVEALFDNPGPILDHDGNPLDPETRIGYVLRKGMWSFVDVPTDENMICTIHYWHRKDANPLRVAQMIAHECGHLANPGPIPGGGQAEEDRADEYARAAVETMQLLIKTGLITV